MKSFVPKLIRFSGSVYRLSDDQDYRLTHRAPRNREGNWPLWDLDIPYPGIYSGHASDYMTRESCDHISLAVIKATHGKPDTAVTVYRAVPDLPDVVINTGDWVTTCRKYAVTHSFGMGGKTKILSKKVRARDLWTDGNSIHEWGYDPQ